MKKKNPPIEELPLFTLISSQNEPVISGAIGGPATGRGVKYQIDNAILYALNLISRSHSCPLDDLAITIEPRDTSGSAVTRWDIGIEPENTNIEAKVSLSKEDLLDWLKNTSKAISHSSTKSFLLVYGEGSNSLLQAFKKLQRVAEECGNDADKFARLAKEEKILSSEKILEILDVNIFEVLTKAHLRLISIHSLDEQIRTLSETISGGHGGRLLVEMLYHKFSAGMEKRLRFHIGELIKEARRRSIKFSWRPDISYSEYPSVIQATIFLLQNCSPGLPVEIVACAVGCDVDQLREAAKPLIDDRKIIEGELWQINELPDEVTHEYGKNIAAKALDALLDFIERHKEDGIGYKQVDNAIRLAEICEMSKPRSVVRVFPVLDKLLKRVGDLELVLYVSNMSRDAGRRIEDRTDQEVDFIARCYICGISWAYQRMPGHLEEARTAYNQSRKIAEGIRSERSLAFIDKCLGRLCRMEAEELRLSEEDKKSRLRESVQLIEDAIERFSKLPETELLGHDIGDCYSLLGRTYLVIGDMSKVETMMLKAYEYLGGDSKEHADLLILHGDYENAKGNYSQANSLYTQALSVTSKTDNVWSEIRARALRQRGLVNKKLKQISLARKDFHEASKIWDGLKRPHNRAEVEWELILIDEGLTENAIHELAKDSPNIRVAIARMHIDLLTEREKKSLHLSSREEVDSSYWKRLRDKARKQETIKNLDE